MSPGREPGVPSGKPKAPGDELSASEMEDFKKLVKWLGQPFVDLMAKKVPELPKKLSELLKKSGPLALNAAEVEFFEDLVIEDYEGLNVLLGSIAAQIWRADIVTWKEKGTTQRGNIVTVLWGHFLPIEDLSIDEVAILIRFFLRTSREEAENEIRHWDKWVTRTEVQFAK